MKFRLVVLLCLSMILIATTCIEATSSDTPRLIRPRISNTLSQTTGNSLVIKCNNKVVRDGSTISISDDDFLLFQINVNSDGLYGIEKATLSFNQETPVELKRQNNAIADSYPLPQNLEDGQYPLVLKVKIGRLYSNPVVRPSYETMSTRGSTSLNVMSSSAVSDTFEDVEGEKTYLFVLKKSTSSQVSTPTKTISLTAPVFPVTTLIPYSGEIVTITVTPNTPTPTATKTLMITKLPTQTVTPTKTITRVIKIPELSGEEPIPIITSFKITPPAEEIPPRPSIPVEIETIPTEAPTVELTEEEVMNQYTVSEWAVSEVTKAKKNQLIPSSIGTNLKKDVTRKEFAAIAFKYCEAYMGKEIKKPTSNPFRDTNDTEILKAYAIGVTKGVSETEFAPNEYITREQMATMMARALKAVGQDISFEDSLVEPFMDHQTISDYAIESVYFMADKEIIKGMGDNTFGAKGTATIEQSLLISERMYQTF